MARKIRLITKTGQTVTTDLYLDGATSSAETVSYTEVAPQIYEATVTAAAGSYTLNLKYSGSLVGWDRCIVGATDATTYPADSVAVNLSGTKVRLTADGLDEVLVESGISAGASLTNDTGTQLTGINARQALSLAMSALAGVLSGVLTNLPIFKPGGKSSGNTRISASQNADGRTTVNLKVPD